MLFPLILAVLAASLSSGDILPMSRSERSVDLNNMNTQLTILEQMMLDLRSEVKTTTAELAVVKSDLLSTTSQLTTVTDELNNLKAVIKPSGINETVLDAISSDVKTNIKYIAALKSDATSMIKDINDSKVTIKNLETQVSNMDAKINATENTLCHKQQSLETKIDTVTHQQNVTRVQVDSNTKRIQEMSILKSDWALAAKGINQSKSGINDLERKLLDMNVTCSSQVESLGNKQGRFESLIDSMGLQQNATRLVVENISAVMDYKIKGLEDKQIATESEITALSKKYDATESSIDNMRSELNETKTNIGHLTPNVKYQAGLQYNLTVHANETLKFDIIWNNDGNGYNSSTGRFTAPVSGTYLLWANVFVSSGQMDMYLRVNEQTGAAGTTYNVDTKPDTAVVTFVIDLVVGDQIYYSKFSGKDNVVYGYEYSSYGGVLLHTN